MTRWKCTVSYIGKAYSGWQTQPDGSGIQDRIESVLSGINGRNIRIFGSGRTDAGVNAAGQVFHFDGFVNMNEEQWKKAMNSLLPDDIHIRSVERCSDRFHARFDAVGKQYEYRINTGEYNVFEKDREYQLCRRLSLKRMKQAAAYLEGTHDFGSFCGNSYEETPDQTRTITRIEIEQEDDRVILRYSGAGFLRYMVRLMTGALIETGLRKMGPAQVGRAVALPDKNAKRFNVPPQGLTLNAVWYESDR